MKRSSDGSDEDEDGGVDKEGLVRAGIGKRQKAHPSTFPMDGTAKQMAADEVRVISLLSVTRCVFVLGGCAKQDFCSVVDRSCAMSHIVGCS